MAACPLLVKKNHGRPQIHQELPAREDGSRRRFRRTGYESVKDAQADVDRIRSILDLAGDDPDAARRIGDYMERIAGDGTALPEVAEVARKLGVGITLDGAMTVEMWLTQWLAGKKTRKSTVTGYESYIRNHLIPHLGHLRLDKLNVDHLITMFDAITDAGEVIAAENQARREQVARCGRGKPGAPKAEERDALAAERAKLAEMKPFRRTTGPAGRKHIRDVLRAALNAAIARRLIQFNAAEHVELTAATRPKPLLWTDERVSRWEKTGEKPSPVMVWTLAQLGRFLDHAEAEEDRLYALYFLSAFRGLRRGESVGVDWTNMDLDAGLLTVSTELVLDGWDVIEVKPKTDSSAATIALGAGTVQVLRDHRVRQLAEQAAWEAADAERIARGEESQPWVDSGKVFTAEDGSWLHPETASNGFARLYQGAGLPPINLRDLRHMAATLIHAGGGDLHTIKEVLRHSTIVLTSDTYTSLLPEVDRVVAETSEGLVPRARKPLESQPVE